MVKGNSTDALKLIFKECAEATVDSFCKSLPYFLITGRKGLKVFQKHEATVCVAKHPHDDNCLLVFPEMFGDFSLTVTILNRLAQSNLRVQLARYTEEDQKKLNVAINKNSLKIITRIKLCKEDIMDWKYPAHILDTDKVSTLSGNKLKNVRQRFNKIDSNLNLIPLSHPDAVRGMRSSILSWASGMVFSGNDSEHDMTGFYDALIEHVIKSPNMFDGFVLSDNREALGFSVWDNTGDTANSLASLSKRSMNGLSEFQKVTACRILSKKGIKRLNLGGSETETLNNFKLKFQPCESISLHSYAVEFENFDMKSVISLNAVKSDDMRFDRI